MVYMKKGMIITIAALMMSAVFAIPTLADNYDFSSGGEQAGVFGKPTSNDNLVTTEMLSDNTRRNKDAAYLPAPYGYFSGDIPTDPSSLYHNNAAGGSGGGYTGGTGANSFGASAGYGGSSGIASNGVSNGTGGTSAATTIANLPTVAGLEASTSTLALNTAPKYYNDGSIGTLYVERTGKTIKVYEGEELANLKKGAGHFASTSTWDGNVALCGHNRGSSAYFSFVKDMLCLSIRKCSKYK
ncbi:hypothetical protein FACS18945_1690 [Bacteroidia bacterium]|nr:hypothetical protein FACS18945_1690 [Bacteroidia bacterium]